MVLLNGIFPKLGFFLAQLILYFFILNIYHAPSITKQYLDTCDGDAWCQKQNFVWQYGEEENECAISNLKLHIDFETWMKYDGLFLEQGMMSFIMKQNAHTILLPKKRAYFYHIKQVRIFLK